VRLLQGWWQVSGTSKPAAHTREEHCTHPTQRWCDCDWCRWLREQAKQAAAAVVVEPLGWHPCGDCGTAVRREESKPGLCSSCWNRWMDAGAPELAGYIAGLEAAAKRRARKNAARRERDQAMRDCGLVRVRGSLGGTFWE
jgi:hypothetical protein